jgi:MoxR-like ATPase
VGQKEHNRDLAPSAPPPPQTSAALQRRAVDFVHQLRGMDLFKAPGIAETIDWCRALAALSVTELDPQSVQNTLGVLLKYQDDLARIDAAQIAQCLSTAQ